jgi:hypothetical protein
MQITGTYGAFTELVSEDGREGLTIVFSPTSISLKERWKNNSLSADFMGDYFANFYARDTSGEPGRREEVKSTVSFVANELIENAMKFTDVDAVPISIRLTMLDGELVFCAINGTSVENSAKYQAAIQTLLSADLWAEYEKRASATGTSSGLGLLSMLTDYSARIGWRFLVRDEQRVIVITTVRLPL